MKRLFENKRSYLDNVKLVKPVLFGVLGLTEEETMSQHESVVDYIEELKAKEGARRQQHVVSITNNIVKSIRKYFSRERWQAKKEELQKLRRNLFYEQLEDVRSQFDEINCKYLNQKGEIIHNNYTTYKPPYHEFQLIWGIETYLEVNWKKDTLEKHKKYKCINVHCHTDSRKITIHCNKKQEVFDEGRWRKKKVVVEAIARAYMTPSILVENITPTNPVNLYPYHITKSAKKEYENWKKLCDEWEREKEGECMEEIEREHRYEHERRKTERRKEWQEKPRFGLGQFRHNPHNYVFIENVKSSE